MAFGFLQNHSSSLVPSSMDLSLPSRSLPTLLPNRNHLTHRSPPLIIPLRPLSSSKALGLRCQDVRARSTEETSRFVTEKYDRSPKDTAVDEVEEVPSTEEVAGEKEEAVAIVDGEQSEPVEFLNKLDIKLDSDNTYSLLIYGTGALVALWLSSAVVSAVDSIPVFPKVMEVVGLAYTVWFSYRYLIFKENRDELLVKVEDIKKQIIGMNDD